MRPNFELMHQALDQIRMSPSAHDQDSWRTVTGCGTTLCFAGWICEVSGGRWVGNSDLLEAELGDTEVQSSDRFLRRIGYGGLDVPVGVPVVHAEDRARRLIGLDDVVADDLFYSCDDLEDLEDAIKNLENAYVEVT